MHIPVGILFLSTSSSSCLNLQEMQVNLPHHSDIQKYIAATVQVARNSIHPHSKKHDLCIAKYLQGRCPGGALFYDRFPKEHHTRPPPCGNQQRRTSSGKGLTILLHEISFSLIYNIAARLLCAGINTDDVTAATIQRTPDPN
ncbi:hypothetical protein KSP40_PGU005572 [Platanthera guangdongensis]|uniref:Uncharacterized protein n=1 Tax=Platanthera guangdongensis TaxID=2320717 RepID=A0ABR2LJR5_9ASPA